MKSKLNKSHLTALPCAPLGSNVVRKIQELVLQKTVRACDEWNDHQDWHDWDEIKPQDMYDEMEFQNDYRQ